MVHLLRKQMNYQIIVLHEHVSLVHLNLWAVQWNSCTDGWKIDLFCRTRACWLTLGVDQGCEGGLMDDAFKFIIQNHGLKTPITLIRVLMESAMQMKKPTLLLLLLGMRISLPAMRRHCKKLCQSTSFCSYWCVWLWLSVLQEWCLSTLVQ